jgi:lipoprotein-anchoring transpeptidase ErfK/SrfK
MRWRPDIEAWAVYMLVLLGVYVVAAPSASAADADCRSGPGTASVVGAPTASVSWRAGLHGVVPVHARVPRVSGERREGEKGRAVGPTVADWLLVLGAARDDSGRCWVRVRLPWRPNAAAGWVKARDVLLRPTRWRVVISRSARRLALRYDGRAVLRTRIVVGAVGTPTPGGLFSIIAVWRWSPGDFLGSYVLPLTAHSDTLQEFGGGDGRVGIHGRGGASLLDPLGSRASHGCVRLSNAAIESVVRRVGAGGLPGIPVVVR